jgi:hypothetical protein
VEVTTLRGAAVSRATTAGAATTTAAAAAAASDAEVDAALWEAAESGRAAGATIERRVVPTQMLSLDLPPPPLFRDAEGDLDIPQIALTACLAKFGGVVSTAEIVKGEPVRRRYSLLRAPLVLLMHARRFQSNGFFVEKNPTIVTFPLKGLSTEGIMGRQADQRLFGEAAAAASSSASAAPQTGKPRSAKFVLPRSMGDAASLAWPALKRMCVRAGLGVEAVAARSMHERRLVAQRAWSRLRGHKYDLLGTVVHGGGTTIAATSSAEDADDAAIKVGASRARRRAAASAEASRSGVRGMASAGPAKLTKEDAASTGSYKCAVLSEAAGAWFEADDIDVRKVLAQSIAVSEAYLLLYVKSES